MSFYLKLTDEQAASMISEGLAELFGGTPTKFENYTFSVTDPATGDKYWLVRDLKYDGVAYNVEDYVIDNYPTLTRYTSEYVDGLVSS